MTALIVLTVLGVAFFIAGSGARASLDATLRSLPDVLTPPGHTCEIIPSREFGFHQLGRLRCPACIRHDVERAARRERAWWMRAYRSLSRTRPAKETER